jgi:hypothetical protein
MVSSLPSTSVSLSCVSVSWSSISVNRLACRRWVAAISANIPQIDWTSLSSCLTFRSICTGTVMAEAYGEWSAASREPRGDGQRRHE